MFTAPNKPTSAQSPAASSQAPLDMKTMYKYVVGKLSPYWTTVGDYLEYSIVERNSFRGANNNKSLAILLENWISTDNGRKPKTWLTFSKVLEELDQDLSISVGSEICASLKREVFSPSGMLFCVVCVFTVHLYIFISNSSATCFSNKISFFFGATST